jgi:uncharacterized protein YndB with AHSA1/START domain
MVTKANKGKAVVTLPSHKQILITREFDAPAHLVWKAWTTPELVMRWWHANRGTMQRADIDLRVGGKWRWVMIANEGFEVGFHGEYQEIVTDKKLAYTEVFEGIPVGPEGEEPALNTITLTARGGKTLVTNLVECRTKEVRDMIIDSGMEAGMQDALDLLEGVATSL